jgi:hypothetical protein
MTSTIDNIFLASLRLPQYETISVTKAKEVIYKIYNSKKAFELFAKATDSWVLFDAQQEKLYAVSSFQEAIEFIAQKKL